VPTSRCSWDTSAAGFEDETKCSSILTKAAASCWEEYAIAAVMMGVSPVVFAAMSYSIGKSVRTVSSVVTKTFVFANAVLSSRWQ